MLLQGLVRARMMLLYVPGKTPRMTVQEPLSRVQGSARLSLRVSWVSSALTSTSEVLLSAT